MTQKRGYLNIAHDILRIAIHGCGITSIVYGGNLNFPIAKKHIEDLVLRELITVDNVGVHDQYITTDRGLEFLHRMETVLSLWDVGQGPRDDAPEVLNA